MGIKLVFPRSNELKILLTGATGMVGRNILAHKKAELYQVFTPSSTELDLLDSQAAATYIKKIKPDVVIHAAGVVGGIQANLSRPVKFLVDNMNIGLNIITAARDNGVTQFLNLSSSCMYPRNGMNPLSEEQILAGELEPTNEGYALAKITSTRLCEYIRKEDESFQYKTIIPCNLYGKYDKFDPQNSHMIPAVIRKLHEAKVLNIPKIDIWGDGEARREFMYTQDLVDFIFYALERISEMPQNINVGLGFDYSINEYYSQIAKVVGFEGEFFHDLSKPVGMRQKLVDVSKLEKFGWSNKTSLNEGLKNTYDYFLSEER